MKADPALVDSLITVVDGTFEYPSLRPLHDAAMFDLETLAEAEAEPLEEARKAKAKAEADKKAAKAKAAEDAAKAPKGFDLPKAEPKHGGK